MQEVRKKDKKHKRKRKNKEKHGLGDVSLEEQELKISIEKQHQNFQKPPHAQKRELSEDDSDHEHKPKRKKKKKIIPEETGDKKGKKSIRQMKREKFAQRQAEAAATAKDQFKTQCLNYLSQWKHDKQNWKFMKVKQVWLLKNKFSATLVPDVSWQLLLEYFESAKGNIRKFLLEDANKIIQRMDEWIESQSEKAKNSNDETENPESSKPDDVSYKRARDLIQCLQE